MDKETEIISNKNEEEDKKTIKNLVISGGGHTFLTFYGILKEAQKSNYFSIENIESIYGTSAGALVGFMISLSIDFDILDKYLINRPWNKVFDVNVEQIVNVFDDLGIFSQRHMCELINPLLHSKDLDPNITLQELYDFNHIEFHVFATELNSFTCVDFSYKTHPTWRIIDVLTATSAIPFLFKPVFVNNSCYIDGCLKNDFPIEECLQSHNEDETLFIKKENVNDISINENSTLENYFTLLIQKVMINATTKKSKKMITVPDSLCTLNEILEVTSNEEKRKNMINIGKDIFTSFSPSS